MHLGGHHLICFLSLFVLCFTKDLKQCLAKNLMTDRGDKNILFTGCSLFKIRSSGVSTLFLNRPESPLENELSGIVLSGGKKMIRISSGRRLLRSRTRSSCGHLAGAGRGSDPASRRALALVSPNTVQVRLPSTPLLEPLRGKESSDFSSGFTSGQCAFTIHLKQEFTVQTW